MQFGTETRSAAGLALRPSPVQSPEERYTISVGVSPSIPQRSGPIQIPSFTSFPARREPGGILGDRAREGVDPISLTGMLREQVRAIDPDLPVSNQKSLAGPPGIRVGREALARLDQHDCVDRAGAVGNRSPRDDTACSGTADARAGDSDCPGSPPGNHHCDGSPRRAGAGRNRSGVGVVFTAIWERMFARREC